MKGTVVHHEHRNGFIVIRDENGAFAIASLQGDYDVERGDIVSGALQTSSDATLFNHTQDVSMEVLITAIGLSEQDAISQILGTH
ncbi:hypothetical protein [Enterobacter sp. Bisph1]|uniref:hypothetical protein n=1 Tax=Enterobacter sp. Bisph1 TaxID=1274399 RepID=UPI00057BD7B9|nr:hypothetical protein [Enterobacter sp. Bisph1]